MQLTLASFVNSGPFMGLINCFVSMLIVAKLKNYIVILVLYSGRMLCQNTSVQQNHTDRLCHVQNKTSRKPRCKTLPSIHTSVKLLDCSLTAPKVQDILSHIMGKSTKVKPFK